ncbi:MAG: hypothetical protein FD170_3276 [Bacteroidetes bacterium]|nr:MAG: hypothetical protein FD170_3276 [Bacteroidota bacterium]
MRKLISISVILLLLSVTAFGQDNRVSVSAGFPINLTNHWLVEKWEKSINFDLNFDHSKDYLLIGGGLRYSKSDISWFRYYDSEDNTISSLTPYLKVGVNLDKKVASLIPHLDLGYTALMTDVEIYNGGKGGFYSAIGLDCNFNITNNIQLGLGANYSMTFLKLDFDYEGAIQHDFIPTEDDFMKSLSMNLNLTYRF